MSFIAKGSSYELDFPTGTQQAVVQSLIVLGTHENTFDKSKPPQNKVLVIFELPAHQYKDKQDQIRNRTISQTYTISTNEKSRMYTLIGATMGRTPTDEERDNGFNLLNMVGKNLFIVIEEGKKGDGSASFKIKVEAPMPDAMPQAALSGPSVLFDLEPNEAGTIVIPKGIPQWAAEDIATSAEYLEYSQKKGGVKKIEDIPMPNISQTPPTTPKDEIPMTFPKAPAPVVAPVAPLSPAASAAPVLTPDTSSATPAAPSGGPDLSQVPPHLRELVLQEMARQELAKLNKGK